jgi:hypothetical protein
MPENRKQFKTFPKHAAWFRMYHELLDDPKAQRLSGELFKFWINTLCLACRNRGTIPSADDVAFALRMSVHDAQGHISTLIDTGLVDIMPDRRLRPHNWDLRQFVSDTKDPTVADRMRRFRKRSKRARTVTPTVTKTVTPCVTASDSVSVSESEYTNYQCYSSQEVSEDSIEGTYGVGGGS